ncbi:MAG: hypothetical protein ACM3JC_00030 [Rudaea sp.]
MSARPPEARGAEGRPENDFEVRLAGAVAAGGAQDGARRLLALAEDVLAQWASARGFTPTHETREGFRLLALHRQGAQDVPSFNACRETCREIAYHYNLLTLEPQDAAAPQRLRMMTMLVRHLALFVTGKMEVEGLGEFCCASRPLRLES